MERSVIRDRRPRIPRSLSLGLPKARPEGSMRATMPRMQMGRKPMRLRPCAIVLALIGISFAASASAEDGYPSHLVKIVLPTASGSTTDTLARLLADRLGQTWSQTVIVENIPGGAMNVGATHVARAAPDGYTLMLAPPSPLTINDLLYRDLSYDPHKFLAVALLAK